MEMTPPSPRRSTPALDEDVTREVFLRLPPNDPKGLVRAAAGCRSWRGILSDAAFAREHGKTHGAPPLLGFLYEELDDVDDDDDDDDEDDDEEEEDDETYWVSHFVSTSTFRPPACQDRPYWHILDSRHGLVLFYTPRLDAEFVVCDLVTGNEWQIHADPKFDDIMCWEWEEEDVKLERVRCKATVLCAKDPCDHLYCHGGPFCIALVGSVEDRLAGRATIYSSLTGEWSDMVELQIPDYIEGTEHSAVLGNKVYVPFVGSDNVVEYNLDEQTLSVIVAPDMDQWEQTSLIGVEEGMLLFASVVDRRLSLRSMEISPTGAARWARHRTIELEPVISADLLQQDVVGFADSVGVLFLSTEDGMYTVYLKTGRIEKVHTMGHIRKVIPYMSFYSGAWWLPMRQ